MKTSHLTRPWQRAAALLLVALLALLVLALTGTGDIDDDTAMRLAWLREVVARGSFDAGYFSRTGAPQGEYIHWTLPFNLLTLAIAAPAAVLAGWEQGFVVALFATGPLSLLAVLGAMVWGLRPVLPPPTRLWAALLVSFFPAVTIYARIGQVDHHIANLALVVALFGWLPRLARRRTPGWHGALAAAVAVVALWQSVETLPYVLSALGLAAAVALGRGTRALAVCAASLPVFAVGAALLDPHHAGLWVDAPYRYGLPHALLLSAVAGGLAAALASTGRLRGVCARLGVVAVVLGAILLGWLGCFPATLVGIAMSPGARDLLWSSVGELKPPEGLGLWVTLVVPDGLAILVCLGVAWRRRRAATGGWWLAAAGVSAATLLLALAARRLGYYAAVPAAIGLAIVLTGRVARDRATPLGLPPAAFLLMMVCAVGTAVTAVALGGRGLGLSRDARCGITDGDGAFARALPPGAVVLADPFLTQHILYYLADVRVFMSGFDFDYPRLEDYYTLLTAPPDRTAQVRAMLRRDGVHAVALCRMGAYPAGGLAAALVAGAGPDWLVRAPLPGATASPLLVFLVRPAAAD